MKHFFKLVAILVLLSAMLFAQSSGKTRTYFIAADEVDWDYAPGGVNKMMGMKFEGYSTTFTEKGPHRIGTVYRKAIYRENTDELFIEASAGSLNQPPLAPRAVSAARFRAKAVQRS